ncbi:MAG: UDP-N-acetylmuramoyl-tripeptide--D-alanyl-D-alanine ligase [Cellvibrionaceae bacterium]
MINAISLSELVEPLKATLHNGLVTVEGVSTDTRSVERGDLFVALKGDRFDAHDFLQDAVEAGAASLLVDRHIDGVSLPQLQVEDTTLALGELAKINRRAFHKPLIAMTGSCGKTTVKEMLSTVLSAEGRVHVTLGNLNNHIGVPLTLLALDEAADYAVIEMGASGLGEIDYLATMAEPDVALLTNVMPAHLEGFGSKDGVAQEKSNIYRKLKPGGTAVLNLDEPYCDQWVRELAETRTDVAQLTFSTQTQSADVYAKSVKLGANGRYEFDLCNDSDQARVSLPLLGAQNVSNALAVAACALSVGVSLESIASSLQKVVPFSGRLVSKPGQKQSIVIDDTYNANPGSVLAAARVLMDMSSQGKEVVLVLGDLGELGEDEVQTLRQLGLDLAALGLPTLFSLGKNSAQISSAFSASQVATSSSQHFLYQQELIQHLTNLLTDNTVVLVKGSRSARMENIVQAITLGGEQ